MTSGGSRARSGPPPDPNSIRSGARTWLTLPAEGFDGDVPEFPLPDENARELELWESLWRTPQAFAWDANQMTLQVAFYVRRFAEAEKPEASANLSTLVRQLSEDLGLNFAGLARNLWRIAPKADGPNAEPDATPGAPVDLTSARHRLRR
jgi:hypothetical protein